MAKESGWGQGTHFGLRSTEAEEKKCVQAQMGNLRSRERLLQDTKAPDGTPGTLGPGVLLPEVHPESRPECHALA